MESRLLSLLPTEQARCREVARQYAAMGSIGCFAAALIEQTLQRADRAIIEGGESEIRSALRELQAFGLTHQAPPQVSMTGGSNAVSRARWATRPGTRHPDRELQS